MAPILKCMMTEWNWLKLEKQKNMYTMLVVSSVLFFQSSRRTLERAPNTVSEEKQNCDQINRVHCNWNQRALGLNHRFPGQGETYWWVNNPTLGEFCFAMIGRADIEGSKSNVAMNAWLPQASYPCGNFSDTSSLKLLKTKGSIGHAFTGYAGKILCTQRSLVKSWGWSKFMAVNADRPTQKTTRSCYTVISESKRIKPAAWFKWKYEEWYTDLVLRGGVPSRQR